MRGREERCLKFKGLAATGIACPRRTAGLSWFSVNLRLLVLVVAFAVALSCKAGPLIREDGAVYLEDVLKNPVRLNVVKTPMIYYDSGLVRYLGTLRAGQAVELLAVLGPVYRVRGQAQQGQVAGWVPASALSPLKPEFLDGLKKTATRQAAVAALVAKNEIAINMTGPEVLQSLGKPQKKISRLDSKGRTDAWDYIRYEKIAQQVPSYDSFGRLVYNYVYVKVPSGHLTVSFDNGLVSAIEQSEGDSSLKDGRAKIVAAPFEISEVFP